jgi:hypothetical protein
LALVRHFPLLSGSLSSQDVAKNSLQGLALLGHFITRNSLPITLIAN